MIDKKILKENSLFADFSDKEIEKLAALFTEKAFKENEIMIPEHAENREMMILIQGSVGVEVAMSLSASAEKMMLTSEDSPGRIIEWSSAIDTTKSGGTASARALKPVKVVVADGTEVMKLMQAEPALGLKLMHKVLLVVASRLKDTRMQLVSMAAQCR
jgi:signal-transduction protein with cAMP-binding, CBS, and nucleotidyltransferase domain